MVSHQREVREHGVNVRQGTWQGRQDFHTERSGLKISIEDVDSSTCSAARECGRLSLMFPFHSDSAYPISYSDRPRRKGKEQAQGGTHAFLVLSFQEIQEFPPSASVPRNANVPSMSGFLAQLSRDFPLLRQVLRGIDAMHLPRPNWLVALLSRSDAQLAGRVDARDGEVG